MARPPGASCPLAHNSCLTCQELSLEQRARAPHRVWIVRQEPGGHRHPREPPNLTGRLLLKVPPSGSASRLSFWVVPLGCFPEDLGLSRLEAGCPEWVLVLGGVFGLQRSKSCSCCDFQAPWSVISAWLMLALCEQAPAPCWANGSSPQEGRCGRVSPVAGSNGWPCPVATDCPLGLFLRPGTPDVALLPEPGAGLGWLHLAGPWSWEPGGGQPRSQSGAGRGSGGQP